MYKILKQIIIKYFGLTSTKRQTRAEVEAEIKDKIAEIRKRQETNKGVYLNVEVFIIRLKPRQENMASLKRSQGS